MKSLHKGVDDETFGVVASLVAAISLLERSPKTGAPSDLMFDMMVLDYKRALVAWRAKLIVNNSEENENNV